MESGTRLDFAEVAIQLEGYTRIPRDRQIRNALGTRKKSNQNLATDLSETYHRVDTSRHAGTADTQITTSDLSVVSQALPETCPAQSGDP